MLKRMKNKKCWSEYSFGECCLYVSMIVGAICSSIGMGFFCVDMMFGHVSPVYGIMHVLNFVVCCAGLMYVYTANKP